MLHGVGKTFFLTLPSVVTYRMLSAYADTAIVMIEKKFVGIVRLAVMFMTLNKLQRRCLRLRSLLVIRWVGMLSRNIWKPILRRQEC